MAEKLYVVIPSAGRPTLLHQTLTSLNACTKPDIFVSTIVVENGPKMGAEAIVQDFQGSGEFEYMHVPTANKSHALNQALQKIEDGLVFFTDDDVRFDPQILVVYANASDGFNSGQFYGGTCHPEYEEQPPNWLQPMLPKSASGFDLSSRMNRDDFFFLGFNWAAYAGDIRKTGGFNTLLGPGSPVGTTVGDETEMQSRLRAANIQAVPLPKATVWHNVPKERSSLRWALRRTYTHGFTRGVWQKKEKALAGISLHAALRVLKHLAFFCGRAISLNRREAILELRHVMFRTGQIMGYRQQEKVLRQFPTNEVSKDFF